VRSAHIAHITHLANDEKIYKAFFGLISHAANAIGDLAL
jgi:hypothetical protein